MRPVSDVESICSQSTADENPSSNPSSGGSANGGGGASVASINLAKRETYLVMWSKIMFLTVLFVATAVVGAATYIFTNRKQKQDFRVRFEDFAQQIEQVTRLNTLRIVDSYESLGLTLTNYASSTKASWPFVSFPEFQSHAVHTITESGSTSFAMAPFVAAQQRPQWEVYATSHYQEWLQTGLDFQKYTTNNNQTIQAPITPYIFDPVWNQSTNSYVAEPSPILPLLHEQQQDNSNNNDASDMLNFYIPVWHFTPINPHPAFTNLNLASFGPFPHLVAALNETRHPVFSAVQENILRLDANGTIISRRAWLPELYLAVPIFESSHYSTPDEANIVGLLVGTQPFHTFLAGALPHDSEDVIVVVQNNCDQQFSFRLNGKEVNYLGFGDHHDIKYYESEVIVDLDASLFEHNHIHGYIDDQCLFTMHIFPTLEFENSFKSSKPFLYTMAVVFIFAIMTVMFIAYDCVVERRQDKVMTTATKSNAIVNSLFPATVRDRLLDDPLERGGENGVHGLYNAPKKDARFGQSIIPPLGPSSSQQQSRLSDSTHGSRPLADLFPHATVMFADIVGFTAWSSVREPSQVFMLLETVYNAFDAIAKKLGVFKVETIGDSYVAAAGLPDPRPDHAFVMVRFARYCLIKMGQVAHRLEASLGPDTSELGMRFGLHSGPVTAGVLRGEKARFQLFGDTVNTAARMESTGEKSKVQISQQTADLLVAGGKAHWIKPRENKVHAKGKGELQTYWLDFSGSGSSSNLADQSLHSSSAVSTIVGMTSSMPKTDGSLLMSGRTGSITSSRSDNADSDIGDEDGEAWKLQNVTVTQHDKHDRLVEWNVDVLQGLLKKILAMRDGKRRQSSRDAFLNSNHSVVSAPSSAGNGNTVLDEVMEIITLPSKPSKYKRDPDTVRLDPVVYQQLHDYVKKIAAMYRANSFHSFEHASHVTQSVVKLLSRVVTPGSINDDTSTMHLEKEGAAILHQYTYGITSDPLTQFACAFSALIHDVDHLGIPNAQLVKEGSELAKLYKNKSVAEQNSVDLAWGLLMEPQYKNLRDCIYTNQSELTRFRQLVVNTVMATDIADKELGALRKKRWETAFASHGDEGTTQEAINRKATIVIEHLIQASDVSHTMQHWHVYLKWNERFFHECYKAYLDGRSGSDPSENWYKGELGFFDFYIIPLAKKLKECGVFGVSSDEYLLYAQANRLEWEKKGKDVVRGYLERHLKAHEEKVNDHEDD